VSDLSTAARTLILPGRFRAVVFDMDGLLLDTEPMWHGAERELLARHGDVFTDADMVASHGRALVETAAIYGERLGLAPAEIEREITEIMLTCYLSGAPLHAGARELVDGLDGRLPMAVASNTVGVLVRQALDAVGLGALDAIASAVDLGSPKPSPEVYLEACRLLHVDPADAVAFEDSPMGIQAAKAAGMFAVGVPERDVVGLAEAGADLVLRSLLDVVIEPR
jgi:mannitol-1-/sugar-/sorbitol-6-/2-deoxyglucose-6-phosphatase